jgi:hypothetical protein
VGGVWFGCEMIDSGGSQLTCVATCGHGCALQCIPHSMQSDMRCYAGDGTQMGASRI